MFMGLQAIREHDGVVHVFTDHKNIVSYVAKQRDTTEKPHHDLWHEIFKLATGQRVIRKVPGHATKSKVLEHQPSQAAVVANFVADAFAALLQC